MYCKNCGEFIPNSGKICNNCGATVKSDVDSASTSKAVNSPPQKNVNRIEHQQKNSVINNTNTINQPEQNITPPELRNRKKRICPSCSSNNVQPTIVNTTNVNSTGGGYSAGQGCCGYFLFGPLGLLCGACGSKQEITTTSNYKTVWLCNDCGFNFRDPAELKREQEIEKKAVIWAFIAMAIILAVVAIFFTSLFDQIQNQGSGSRWK